MRSSTNKCINVIAMSKEELLNNSIKKPSTPHLMKSQTALTKQEIDKRMIAERQLRELGISTSVFDSTGSGHEDPDILRAIILANQGKQIPEELKLKIKRKKMVKHKSRAKKAVKVGKVTQVNKMSK